MNQTEIEHSFERCPHDRENPYAQISRSLIRDNSISPECRMLIIYLLSHKDNWQINATQLINYFRPHFGRDRLYALIREAIGAGYMKKVEKVVNGLKRIGYHISESPKFKKFLPLPENPHTENPHTENSHIKEEHIQGSSKEEINNKEEILVPVQTATSEGTSIAHKLWDKIRAVHPKAKPPRLDKWAAEIDRALRIDRRTPDELSRVIEFAFTRDAFWAKTLQSAEGLRRNFDKIWVKMAPLNNEATHRLKNLEITKEARSQLKVSGSPKAAEFFISETELIRLDTGVRVSLYLEPSEFELKLLEIFNLTKD